VPAIPAPLEALAATVQSTVRMVAVPLHACVYAVAPVNEVAVDAAPAPVQARRRAVVPVGGGAVGSMVEARLRAIAAVIQPSVDAVAVAVHALFDVVAPAVKPVFHPVAAVAGGGGAGRDQQSRAERQCKPMLHVVILAAQVVLREETTPGRGGG
jgi:hypothetical protein